MRIAKSFLRSQPFLGLLLALTLGVLAISPRVGTTLGVEAATLLVRSQLPLATERPAQSPPGRASEGAIGGLEATVTAPFPIEEPGPYAVGSGSSPVHGSASGGLGQEGGNADQSETPVSAYGGPEPSAVGSAVADVTSGQRGDASLRPADLGLPSPPASVSGQSGEALVARGEDRSMDTRQAVLAPSPSPLEERMLELLNARRAQRGMAPLAWNSQLLAVARSRSEDMVSRDYFSHYSPEGDTVAKGLMQTDLRGGFAELLGRNNSADGEESAQRVAQAFDASPAHSAELAQQRFIEAGIGVFTGAGGMRYYTVLLYGP